ncbi:MAG: biotin transporter BioY [Deltaproteobacteria bacterium]|nr:biotin transporter BioY [Deltaproteobacteria bacterium]
MRRRTKEIVMVSLFAALTAVGAFIKIPIPYVPLTLQTLMVMLAALILGSRLAALSQALYLTIGLLGLPIFAQGGGPGYVLQPSFGFLLGFIVGAYVIGRIVEKEENVSLLRTLAALILGQAAIYSLGIAYLHFNLNFIIHKPTSIYTTLKIGLLVFIPGDILKTLVAALVVAPIRQRLMAIKSITF